MASSVTGVLCHRLGWFGCPFVYFRRWFTGEDSAFRRWAIGFVLSSQARTFARGLCALETGLVCFGIQSSSAVNRPGYVEGGKSLDDGQLGSNLIGHPVPVLCVRASSIAHSCHSSGAMGNLLRLLAREDSSTCLPNPVPKYDLFLDFESTSSLIGAPDGSLSDRSKGRILNWALSKILETVEIKNTH